MSKSEFQVNFFKDTLVLRRGIMPLVVFVALSLLVFTLSRIGLSLWCGSKEISGHFFEIFVQGLRSDFSIVCTMYAPAFFILLLASILHFCKKPLLTVVSLYIALVFTVQLVMELATPPFIIEYGVRPNHLFVDYLIYPKEVISTLIGGHLFALIFSLLAAVFCFVLSFLLAQKLFRQYEALTSAKAFVCLLLLALICAAGIRSTVGHRPLNPSMLSFSNDPLANDLPVNSSFKVFYALRHYGENDLNEGQLYAYDDDQHILKVARLISARNEPEKTDPKCPLNQIIKPSVRPLEKRNVVVILEESFGADFVKSLGGLPLTPEFEKLAREGWFFRGMHAAGHRSVRGIEAVTASYPPSPLASQVKLEHATPMATLMQIYKSLGYKTSFIYGGESHFDNMRTYFLYNGAEEVIEQKDYENPSFEASWGVSDEDLFDKADERFSKWQNEGVPFCSVVFSSSFHDPFDIPQGKVDIGNIKTKEPLRLAAVKYADFALGKFFEKAKKRDYFRNTVFVVIADHESRVQSQGEFPADKFLIPALIIGPDLKARNDDRIVSQIDVLPTLLSLTGVSGEFPLIGQDLTRDDAVERAAMDYNELFGFRMGNKFEVLMPERKAAFYEVSGDRFTLKQGKALKESKNDPAFAEMGMALENLGLAIYKNRWNDASCIKGLSQ